MLGPDAMALATRLGKEFGLSPAKVSRLLGEQFGISITPGGVVGAIARQARSREPTYAALVEGVRASSVVAPDETGGVEGSKAWLWAFVGDGVTVYRIAAGRGYEQAVEVLGTDFDGVLERDGWAPYRRFARASHPSCVAHLLRRTSEMIADSVAGQARIPHALRRLLLDALELRERRASGSATPRSPGRWPRLRAASTPYFGVTPRTAPTRGCCAICKPSASTCSPSSPIPASRRPTGVPSRRSAPR